jgi:hypothetical protein
MAELSTEFFGDEIGSISFYQLPMADFNHVCSSVNSDDNTGMRLYAGCHVAVRYLCFIGNILEEKAILELGCGTGTRIVVYMFSLFVILLPSFRYA